MPIGLLCPAPLERCTGAQVLCAAHHKRSTLEAQLHESSCICHNSCMRNWVSGAVTRPPSSHPPLGLCGLCVVFICAQTLCCANTADDGLLQVTPQDVRVVDAATGALVHQWTAPAGLHINTASASPTQVGFPTLLLFSAQPNYYNTAYYPPGACKLIILTMDRLQATPA